MAQTLMRVFNHFFPGLIEPPPRRYTIAEAQALIVTHALEAGFRGFTDEEAQIALGMPGNTERPRRIELQRMHLIVDSGEQRRTRTGRFATVYLHPAYHIQYD